MIYELFSLCMVCVGGYLVGSFPTGFIIARLNGISDITRVGSGNIGATNISRVLGVHYFFLVLALDACKAAVYMLLVMNTFPTPMLHVAAAMALLIGNIYSLFLYGRGGKGIATGIGIICAFMPGFFLWLLVIWLLAFAYFRTVGIASVIGLFCAPFLVLFLYGWLLNFLLVVIFISVFGIIRHQDNIRRYLKKGR